MSTRHFVSKPSQKYLRALEALRALLAEERGADSVTRAFAEVINDQWRANYAARENLKPATGRHVCIHRLLGKHRAMKNLNEFTKRSKRGGADPVASFRLAKRCR